MLLPRLESSSIASVGAMGRESIFFGPGVDVERSKIMLATIRSAMDREFADSVETSTGGGNPRSLAASFSRAWTSDQRTPAKAEGRANR